MGKYDTLRRDKLIQYSIFGIQKSYIGNSGPATTHAKLLLAVIGFIDTCIESDLGGVVLLPVPGHSDLRGRAKFQTFR